ncbi:MAG: hypothetical protein AB7H70_09845 [Rhodospirillaceae bacterium]
MTKNTKNRDGRNFTRRTFSVAAVTAMLALAACASDGEMAADAPAETAVAAETPAPAPAPVFGAANPAPRFVVPSAANQAPPSVNTVPSEAPAPRSSDEERDAARKGLVADIANARHNDVGGRTLPVVVRPYVETAGGQSRTPMADATPEPDTGRLDAAPPPRPAEAGGAPAKPAAGPAPANRIPTGS